MGAIEDRIKSLGYSLPEAATPVANYVTTVHVKSAGLVFTSGHVPRTADGGFWTGKLGVDISIDEAYKAAQNCTLGVLGSLKNELGDLDRVTRVVKLLCLVNSAPDFTDHPVVANGASDLMVEIFGDKGKHARSAVGLAALPGNVCIEVEMVVEVS
jgi:enamine deaminase RidA (YjgF/YER057c/UK114 family)